MVGVVSSLRDRIIPYDTVFFGEVGLNGEIRPVANGHARLNEAAKHGFKRAIIPKSNKPKETIKNLQIHAVSNIQEALSVLADLE
jgi:DNA repair protein RadA/Sms